MRFPAINDHPLRKVSVPQLSGGVNKTDHPSYINDNQLTDCNNMWFKDGRLRTRPGIESKRLTGYGEHMATIVKDDKFYAFNNSEMTDVTTGKTVKYIERHGNRTFEAELINNILVAPVSEQQQGVEKSKLIVFSESIEQGTGDEYGLFLGSYVPGSNELADNITPYKPILKTGVNPTTPTATPNGYMFEGLNLLDSSYIIKCNTEGAWAWVLPTVSAEIDKITIKYMHNDENIGEQTADIWVDAFERGELSQQDYPTSNVIDVSVNGGADTVKAVFKYHKDTNSVWVCCKRGDEYICDTEIYSFQSNNLTIDVTCQRYEDNGYGLPIRDNYSKITSMTMARWFGGARGGMQNGTRLFVAGGKEEGIIRWSDLNRPNYFSENNYAYVGDGSKITALAQQDDMLVIFQEHAITYATYIEGVEYTAEDVMKDRVVDVTTLSARFPLTNIHSEIGCDCKDTVRLCNNRLVWLTSEGKVYCLVNNNQYNERNVREISYAIEKLLKRHSKDELKTAKSATADGKYFLFIGQKVYVLDYGNTSFEYYTYQSHEKSLKNYLSWYMWTLPDFVDKVTGVEGIDDRLCIIANCTINGNNYPGVVLEINLLDCKTYDNVRGYANAGKIFNYPIPCSFRTKLFAFSGAERMKRIPNCNIAVCKIPGEIEVSFVTDNGSGEPRHICIDEEVSEDNPDAVKRMTLYPNANGTCLFGIEMKSESVMAVEGISISYKEMRDRQ